MGSLFLALVLVFAGLLYATRVNVVNIELKAADAEMARIIAVVQHEQLMLDTTTHDWAHWDESFEYLAGKNPDFVASNLSDQELAQLGVNAMVFLDGRNRVVWGQSYQLDASDSALTPTLKATLLAPLDGHEATGASSYARLIGGNLVVESVQPITPSTWTAPSNGTMITARVIDLTHVLRLAGSGSDWLEASDTALPLTGASQAAHGHLSPQHPQWVSLTRPHELMAYGLVGGAPGTSAVLLRAPVRSLGYDGTPQLIAVLVSAMVLLGYAWSAGTFRLIEHTSLSRMSWLRNAVASVGESADPRARIDVGEGRASDEVVGVASEINSMLSALESSLRAQREGEERMRSLVENMADAVLVLDLDGTIEFASPQITTLTGWAPAELLGREYRTIVSAESQAVIESMLGGEPGPGEGTSAEVTFVGRKGQSTPVELSTSTIKNADGELVAVQWIARDITERKMFEDQLVHLADHDHLTGLYNRRRFEEELERQLAETRRRGGEGALLWLDLDGFKEINDSLGHKVGDDILIALGGKLRGVIRADQIVARLGGDEFGVLLPHADLQDAETAALRILNEIRTGVSGTDIGEVWITASIGIVTFPQHGTSVAELSSHADLAMYAAKRDGRNRFSVYQPDQSWEEEFAQRSTWAGRIESALAENRLVAYAQPIISLADDSVTRYELLIRMIEDGEAIQPVEFLGAAEDLGLIGEIDRLMIRHATRLVSAAEKTGRGIKVSVNLSATTLADQALLRYVRSQIAESGANPGCVGFEITETALIRNFGRALHFMSELRALGCEFALDDFGSGYTSFYHLRHMPLDILKIDGSLVRGFSSSSVDTHLVRAILELARGLGIRATAESVEDERTLDLLRTLGVDEVQGFHLGEPQPAEDLLAQRREPPAKQA